MWFVMDENKKTTENNQQPGSGDYEFVTETIKKRPVNKKKICKKIFFTLFLAILFGVVACVTFVLLYPRVKEYLNPDDGTVAVSLPVEEPYEETETVVEEGLPLSINESQTEEENTSGDASETDKNLSGEVNTQEDTTVKEEADEENKDETSQPSSNEDGDVPSDSENADNGNENKKTEQIINQVVETIEKNLELDDYRLLLRKISEVANKTQKSLVTVSGISSDTDWFNNSYESNNSTIGLIAADNGKELLIISPTNIFKNAINVRVTFVDGQTYPARIKKSDSNTGLCVVGVELSKITEETMQTVEKAEFGGLATSAVGVPVIAVGAPYGSAGSYGIGQITSNSTVLDKTDTNVGIISTDIYGSTTASGVLVNYEGRIVGILCHENMAGDMPNLLRAYAVTDISDTIEKLSNGQELAKLGIYGTDVTEDANERLGVPFGTYIKEVVPDSPAMKVGLRNGDVIVKIGTTEINNFSEYKAAMLKCHPMDIVVLTVMRPGREDYSEVTYEVTLEAL